MRLKRKTINKGAPSGFVISLLVHAGAVALAGMFVVFTVTQKQEQKFVPPKPVDRPKMKLKKPKVKVKKTSKPKSTTRIVTKVQKATMPDIQLPELSGIVDGIAGDVGGFDLAPDINEVTAFGTGQSIGNDFVGTFYDIKRDRRGRNLPEHSREGFVDILQSFLKKDFKKSVLSRFYQSPQKLYTTTFAMPPDLSLMAPQAFGEENTVGYFWIAHYKGELVYPEDITFRFWGAGDDVLAVKVDGEYVFLSVGWNANGADALRNLWRSTSADSDKYPLGNRYSVVGDWITLEAGKALPMEVVLSEIPGGNFQALLCVEVKGVEYPRNPFRKGPTLPIFKTEEPTLDLVEAIHSGTIEGDLSVTNGPVFRDYFSNKRSLPEPQQPEPVENPDAGSDLEERFRIWTMQNGRSIEAEFLMVMGDKVVLKSQKGKQLKVPKNQFGSDDLHFISLSTPPQLAINFKTNRRQLQSPEQPPRTWVRPIYIFGYEFGVNIEQKNTRDYPHELTVEYFAIGDEVDGDNFVLLDREKKTFTLTSDNKRSFSYRGDQIKTIKKAILPDTPLHGVNYGGYLVTVTDERGIIIQHSATREFLFENLDALKKITIGKHFDRDCNYAAPPRYTFRDRPGSM